MINKTIQNSEDDISFTDSKKIQSVYSEKFKEFRELRFSSQAECAKHFEVSQPTISNIENGSRLPKQGLEIQIKKEWGLSLETVIDYVINGDENFDTTTMQILDMLKSELPSISENGKESIFASIKHIMNLDKGGNFQFMEHSTALTSQFRRYGWSFTMRQLLNHMRDNLNALVPYDRMVITRRHPNIPGAYSESIVISTHMVWWNHWDNKKSVNRTEGIHASDLKNIFTDTDPMGDKDLIITEIQSDNENHIYANYNSSLWFPITMDNNEESLLIFTRHMGHGYGDFTVQDYNTIKNLLNHWIPDNVHQFNPGETNDLFGKVV
tara:strand:- start:679 stop:1650 length:972 start_codon:yes stop_codon:yes gene_type:complete